MSICCGVKYCAELCGTCPSYTFPSHPLLKNNYEIEYNNKMTAGWIEYIQRFDSTEAFTFTFTE